MANTISISNLQAQVWYNELFADVQTILFMDKFMGEGPNNPIQVISDLAKNPGDTITVPLTTKLSGAGVSGDSELEGNEEEILSYSFAPKIDQLRNAVRLKGRMDERKVAYSMRKDAKEKLKLWWAERFDREFLSKLTGDINGTLTSSALHANTPTAPVYSATVAANRQIFAGGQTAESGLTATMTFDTKCIDAAKQQAMLSSPKVRAIKMTEGAYKGEDFYIIIVHPFQATALRQDPVWNQAQREANNRGESNPILSGALGIYNGCAVYQHELIYTGTDGSSQAATARAILLGQQAGVFLKGRDAEWVEKSFDFGNKWAIAAGYIFGVQKTVFNSKDYGLITISTAASAASTS
jgi:N4-gp56 family major capsid protein